MENRSAFFLDRDGVIIVEVCYLSEPSQVRLLAGSAAAIAQLNRLEIPVVVVTNQAGVAHGYFPESRVAEVHRRLDELLAAGWEVGSHGFDHPALPSLDQRQLTHELAGAKEVLEQRLTTAVTQFAYPYGAHDDAVREATRAVYEGACGTRLALAAPADLRDPFELPRVDAYYLSGFSAVKAIDSLIGRGYLALRRAVRALRA